MSKKYTQTHLWFVAMQHRKQFKNNEKHLPQKTNRFINPEHNSYIFIDAHQDQIEITRQMCQCTN